MDTEKAHAVISSITESIQKDSSFPFRHKDLKAVESDLMYFGKFLKTIILPADVDPEHPLLVSLSKLRNKLDQSDHLLGLTINHLQETLFNRYLDIWKSCGAYYELLKNKTLPGIFENYIVPASALIKAMADVIYPQEHDIKNLKIEFFRETYNKNSPLELVYKLKKMMDNHFVNPAMLIHYDPMDKEKVLAGFGRIIRNVFMQFWMVECFASGLLHDGVSFRQERIENEYQLFSAFFERAIEKEKEDEKKPWFDDDDSNH